MPGYRQSSYDPEAYVQPGAPVRPYNWVQWTGVALGMAGLGILLVHLAGELGLIAPLLDGSLPTIALLFAGVILINSRRGAATLVEAEQLGKNRKILLITVAICAAILGVVTVITFSGD